MASGTVVQVPITVTADDVPATRRTAEALRDLLRAGPVGSACIVLATGQRVEIPASLVAALQYLASLLGQGDAVTLVPVQRDVSLAEAATLLGVSVTLLSQLLDTGELASRGEGDDRRVRVSDVVGYKQRRSADNRRDLATSLAIAQETGAYDYASTMAPPAPIHRVVLDANVLYPASLRDLLLRCAEKERYRL